MVFNLNQQFILAIIIIWLIVITLLLLKTVYHYNQLTKGIDQKNLSAVLDKILSEIRDLKKETTLNGNNLETEKNKSLNYLQKVGLVRFNPFAEVGGDQSFTIAFLNGNNNGIVLTSLHSRSGTRWYAKTIKNNQGLEYELSKEEKEALRLAQIVDKT